MAEQKIEGMIINKEGTMHTVKYGDNKIELDLSDRVKNFYKDGLTLARVYSISYDEEQELITFAREKSLEDQQEKPERKISPLEDKEHKILAQSTLKEAVLIVTSQHHTLNNSDEIFEEVKAVHKNLYKYMLNRDYEK